MNDRSAGRDLGGPRRGPRVSFLMVNVKSNPSRDRSGLYAVATIVSAALVLVVLIQRTDTRSWSLPFQGDEGGPQGQPAVGPVVHLPKVIVRVRAAESDVYVNAAFDLEVTSEQDKEAVRRQMPRLRDATIEVLSGMNSDDARGGSSALATTKARLLERFRTLIPARHLEALYVTSYLAFPSE